MRISDWSSDVCSSDLPGRDHDGQKRLPACFLEPCQNLEAVEKRHFDVEHDDSGAERRNMRRHQMGIRDALDMHEAFLAQDPLEEGYIGSRIIADQDAGMRPRHKRSEESRVGKEGVSTC